MRKFSIILLTVVGISAMVHAQEEVNAPSKFKPKYFCELNSGMLAIGDYRAFAHIKNGVSLHPNIDVSFGLGVEGHTTGRYMPLFLEGRYNILTGKTRPFVSLHAGYLQIVEDWSYGNWGSENSNHKGFTCGARFGVQQQISPSISFMSSVGYRFSATQYERSGYGWWIDLPVEPITMLHNMNRFELSIGLIFK